MRLKAITGASAILWGACMLIVGLIHLGFPSYGTDYLQMVSSVYPGFHAARSFGDVIVGTIYGLVDGAIVGVVFGLLYRWVAGSTTQMATPAAPGIPSSESVPLRRAS